MCACVRACMRACGRACVCGRVCGCVPHQPHENAASPEWVLHCVLDLLGPSRITAEGMGVSVSLSVGMGAGLMGAGGLCCGCMRLPCCDVLCWDIAHAERCAAARGCPAARGCCPVHVRGAAARMRACLPAHVSGVVCVVHCVRVKQSHHLCVCTSTAGAAGAIRSVASSRADVNAIRARAFIASVCASLVVLWAWEAVPFDAERSLLGTRYTNDQPTVALGR